MQPCQLIRINAGLVADVREMIDQTRGGVARTVNAGMTLLYWRIGKRIQMEVLRYDRAEYGKRILATLSQQLGVKPQISQMNADSKRDLDTYVILCELGLLHSTDCRLAAATIDCRIQTTDSSGFSPGIIRSGGNRDAEARMQKIYRFKETSVKICAICG